MNIKRIAPLAISAALITGLLSGCSTTHYYTAKDFQSQTATIQTTPAPTTTQVPAEQPSPSKGLGERAKAAAEKAKRAAQKLIDEAKASKQASSKPGTSTSGAKAKALTQLAGLKVQEANYGVEYNRTQDFGPAWYDYDHNGCDTRNDVLRRDLTHITYRANDPGCTVATGVLRDPYTGRTINFTRGQSTSMAIQIDHVWPLLLADQHGADSWSADKRLRYANDAKNVLLAVDGPSNGAKGAKGPADWMPSNTAYRCLYVEKFVNIGATYGLTISRRDAAKVRSVLATCD